MLKSRRFREKTGDVYYNLHIKSRTAWLEKELEILEEEIDAMAALKESLQNKEAHKKSKTHDESDVTIKVTYPKEVFLPPSEWNWNLIVQSIYPACDAELVCWTIPHPSGPTW